MTTTVDIHIVQRKQVKMIHSNKHNRCDINKSYLYVLVKKLLHLFYFLLQSVIDNVGVLICCFELVSVCACKCNCK